MADPSAVLLVPTEKHRGALLQEGPCGARPPVVVWWTCTDHPLWRYDPSWSYAERTPSGIFLKRALVLAWEDKSVLEGLERLHHHATEFSLAEKCRWKWNLKAPSDWMVPDQVFEVVQVARLAEEMGLGTVVCLDAEGKEISDG